MCCILFDKLADCFDHKVRLLCATINVAFGSGFLIYSTYATNNIQIVGTDWVNNTFDSSFGYFPDERTLSILWADVVASKEVGKILGTLIIPVLAEKLGRKNGLILNDFLTILGCYLCLISSHSNFYLIVIGRIILGITMICGAGLASLFLIEVAPLEYRGVSGALIQIFRAFGGLAGMVLTLPQIMGTKELWTWALAIPAIPAAVQFLILLCSSESPRHLFITQDRPLEAAQSIRFYQGIDRVAPALKELSSEKTHIQQQQTVECQHLIRSRDFWRPFLLATLCLTNRSLAGILLVQSYSTDFFISAGFSRLNSGYSTVVLGVCHLISAVSVCCTVEKLGRKPLLIGSNIGCMVTLTVVAIASYVSESIPSASYLTVGGLVVFMLIYPVLASVSNIVASEICHQNVRSYAFTCGLLLYSVVCLLSTYVYPVLKHKCGVSWSFLPFIFMTMFCICVYVWLLPETLGRTFESIAFEENGSKNQKENDSGFYSDKNSDKRSITSEVH